MPTLSPQVTPYYGGGQVANPANVKSTSGAPSSTLTQDGLGTLAVDNSAGNIYGLASKSGGVDTWVLLGGSSGAISAINGTANQITANTVGNVTTLSLPAAITAPGSLTTTTSLSATTTITSGTGITATTGGVTASAGNIVATLGNITATAGSVSAGTTITAGTSMTATLGAITATNGNLVLGTAGNKLSIATGANASVGTSVAMTAGTVTISTTAVTASSKIFLTANTPGGTQGTLSAPTASIVAGTSFVINSSSNTDTSTVNWWLIN